MFEIEALEDHPVWKHAGYVGQLQQLAAIHFGLYRSPKIDMRPRRRRASDEKRRRPTGAYFTALLKHVMGLEEQELIDKIKIDHQPFERFMRFESRAMDDARHMDMLASFCMNQLAALASQEPYAGLQDQLDTFKLIPVFLTYSSEGASVADLATSNAQPIPGAREDLFDLGPRHYEGAASYLTNVRRVTLERDRLSAASYYYCYRYSTDVGDIAKSVMRIVPPTRDDPYCRFNNRLKLHSGTIRRSNGLVWRSRDWIYFAGTTEQDRSIKGLIIRAYGDKPAGPGRGLVISHSRHPLIGRLALVPVPTTKIPPPGAELTHFDEEIRTVSELTDAEFASPDFIANIRPLIRNDMKFKLTSRLFCRPKSGRKRTWVDVDQRDMVVTVKRELKVEFAYGATAETGKPFNPADHEFYPFNQALICET